MCSICITKEGAAQNQGSQPAQALVVLIWQITQGGQLEICPTMCFICTRKPAIHCPSIRLGPFLLQIIFGIMSTRGCAWIHVGHSVCKLAGLQAHNDYQNLARVVLHGKTAWVGLHPQLLDLFAPIFLQWYLFVKDSIPPKIMWFEKVGGLLWIFCGEKWGPRCGQLDVCAGTG
jgi:hypothetical protein